MRFIDLTGLRFGKLVVLKENGKNLKRNVVLWECVCDCGNICTVAGIDMKRKLTTSCGCMSSRKIAGERNKTHGMAGTPLYGVWRSMRDRCKNPNNKSYKDYGGRGISVCEKWLTFEGFYEDMGNSYAKGLTIERVDSSKGYNNDNCTWIPKSQQTLNRRNNCYFTYNGETLPLQTLCKKNNVTYSMVKKRITLGWSIERALETPSNRKTTI